MNFKKTVAIVAAAGALTALALPAMAETTLYGSARLQTFYNMADEPTTGKTAGVDEHLQTNSRFGANFSNGDVTGKVEYGASGGNGNIRLLNGTWNFGSGKLTVGQDYNSYYFTSEQVHNDDNVNNGYGSLWDTRQAQIRVNLTNGVYFAAITPTGNVAGDAAGNNLEKTSNVKIYLPKLNVGYAGKAGTVGYNVGVVGQTYSTKIGTNDKQVTALLGYANATAGFGATTLKANVSFAQNAGNMGFSGRGTATTVGTDIKNTTGFEGFVQASQKISDTISGNVGLGYTYDKKDVTGAKADDKLLFFVNAPVTLAKNVSVTPEFSYYDQLNDAAGKDEKKKAYAIGAKWQINF